MSRYIRSIPAALKADRLTFPCVCCCQAVSGVQGGDIRLLNVADLVYWTSYLVIQRMFLPYMMPQSSKMRFSPCIEELSRGKILSGAAAYGLCFKTSNTQNRVAVLHCS